MTTRRIDFVDTDLQTGWGDLEAMPRHEPVIRPDKEPAVFECSGCGECVTSCPSPMVCLGMESRKQHRAESNKFDFEDSDLPASCSDVATTGEMVATWLGVIVLGVFALLGLAHAVSGLMKYLETAV